jgi:alpha-L-rhamnosidase
MHLNRATGVINSGIISLKMNTCFKTVVLIATLCSGYSRRGDSLMTIQNLRCEYLSNPIGIDVARPRLSWELSSGGRNSAQTAYEIMVASDSLSLSRGQADLWETGRIESNQTSQITYGGSALHPGSACYWKVRVWDEKSRMTAWSAIACWSVGLTDIKDWKAKWIGSKRPDALQPRPDSVKAPPALLLRKEFKVGKRVSRAVLYITALGIYEANINGVKVGNQVLSPEWTDYYTRVQYQAYDVRPLLKPGKNVLGAMIADGWYAGPVFSHFKRGSYGFDRRLLAQLAISFDDGSSETIYSDGSWRIFENGPVREASIFGGEVYDNSKSQAGWNQAGFDDSRWQKAIMDTAVSLTLNAQMNEPVRVIENIKPVRVFKTAKGTCIFDLGRNIAGWIKLSLPYNPGSTITIRYAEALDRDSSIYIANLRTAKQTDVYIPAKEKRIDYEPRFTYHGFRYAEITGLVQEPELDNVCGRVVASSSPSAGNLETSSPDINQLWKNILWTQQGNMYSVPTDCPQRDERAGWMGDAQVFSQTAIFNLDMAAFFTKWMRDVRDVQLKNGCFPDVAPQVKNSWNLFGSPAWADAGVIIPWKLYENYGDTAILRTQFTSMKKFIDFVWRNNPDLIWEKAVGNMYGDWLNGNTIIAEDYPKTGAAVPDDVFATSFFAHTAEIVAHTAKLLDSLQDYHHYDSLARAIKHTFVRKFIDPDGRIKGGTQAGYALALDFGLVPEDLEAKAARNMADAVEVYDYRISTGIQTTIRLMNQLSAHGYNDMAYQLLQSHRVPSWLYAIDQGATTVWERWDGYVAGRGFQDPGMNSFNHCAFGSVGEWLYRNVLGINNDPEQPGYKHFFIRPVPGGGLSWAKGSYHSIAGNIAVFWKKEEEDLLLNVQIPVNTEATIILAAAKQIFENGVRIEHDPGIRIMKMESGEIRLRIGSGSYSFKIR